MNNVKPPFDQILASINPKTPVEKLQDDFDRLTVELKEMESSDSQYGRVWDERAEIKRKILEL